MPDEPTTRKYQVSLARIEVKGLYELSSETLHDSWHPGTKSSRYGREWRLSRPDVTNGHWIGRIGFVKPGEVTTLQWSDEEEDFVEGDAPGGVVVPFVIDVAQSVVAYQLRGNLVKPNTFTGALEAVLNEAGTYLWDVTPLVIPRSFETWKSDITRVTSFHFRLERPNPNWLNRPLIEDIVEALDAEVATLGANSEQIDTETDLFRQALNHVLHDYGTARVDGIDNDGFLSRWRTKKEVGGIVTPTTRVEAESEDVEVPAEALVEAMSTMSERMGVADDDDDPDENDEDEASS